jgi:hypothetical protein
MLQRTSSLQRCFAENIVYIQTHVLFLTFVGTKYPEGKVFQIGCVFEQGGCETVVFNRAIV